MSASKYEADNGAIHRIQLSAAKLAVASNTVPTAAIDSTVKVKISKGNREFGLRPRGVTMFRTLTGGTGGSAVSKNVYTFLPILSKTVFDGATFASETTHTYKGNTWTVLDKRQEDN
jgi:hypothetical protein